VTFRNTTPISTGVFQETFYYHPAAPIGSNGYLRYPFSGRTPYCQPYLRRRKPAATTDLKEPADKFEPDATKLQESCQRLGGDALAIDWILVVSKHGASKDALIRTLDPNELDQMDFPGGFQPRQAYDGFFSKDRGPVRVWTLQGADKDALESHKYAPHHLRKFHFGLTDPCKIWYVRWAFFTMAN